MCSICEIYKSKILTKHVSCECRCKFDGRKCNSNEQWNNDKCRWECKKHHIFEKGYIGILLHVVAKTANIYCWQFSDYL